MSAVPNSDAPENRAFDRGATARRLAGLRPGRDRVLVLSLQVTLIVVVLAAWQWLPEVSALRAHIHFLDPFFISSPRNVAAETADILTGRNDSVVVWPYLWRTVQAAVIGTVIGMVLGMVCGLVLSNSLLLSRVVSPFITAINAVPRIAIIPVIVVIVGPTLTASIVVVVLVVFFIAFFSAFEGGRSVPQHLLENCALLGAGSVRVMLHVRLPYVLAWSLASLPLALTFAVISVVTAEILTGIEGMGRLITVSTSTADSSLTFAVVVVLSVVSVVLVGVVGLSKNKILHWWGK